MIHVVADVKADMNVESPIQLIHGDHTIGWVCTLFKKQTEALYMLEIKHQDLQSTIIMHITLGTSGNIVLLSFASLWAGSVWRKLKKMTCLEEQDLLITPNGTAGGSKQVRYGPSQISRPDA